MTSPKNATNTRNGRQYVWPPTGETFDSVTTILNSLPKHALKNWAAKMVATFAVDNIGMLEMMDRDAAIDWLKREPLRSTQRAATLGSAIHAAIEHQPHTIPDDVAPYLDQWHQFNAAHNPEYVASELTVYNRNVGYAGTADAIIISPKTGCRYVVDWKTGKNVYPEAALQLAAYAHAQWWDLGDQQETIPQPISRGLIVHLQPDHYSVHQVTIAGTALFDTFRHLAHIHRWLSGPSREALVELGTTRSQQTNQQEGNQ